MKLRTELSRWSVGIFASLLAVLVVSHGRAEPAAKREKATKAKKTSKAKTEPTVTSKGPGAAEPARVPGPAGNLQGVVTIAGGYKNKPEVITIGVDVSTCGTSQTREALLVSASGGVQNAVVTLDTPPVVASGQPALPTTVVVDQRTCTFLPHVVVIPKNGMVRFTNNDPILHNVRVASTSEPMNRVATHEVTIDKTFSGEGPHPLRCDFHAWMKGYVFVARHAYTAVSDAEGRFAFHVPPGKYAATIWHETMGTLQITLDAAKKNDVAYPAAKAVVPPLGQEAASEWE